MLAGGTPPGPRMPFARASLRPAVASVIAGEAPRGPPANPAVPPYTVGLAALSRPICWPRYECATVVC